MLLGFDLDSSGLHDELWGLAAETTLHVAGLTMPGWRCRCAVKV